MTTLPNFIIIGAMKAGTDALWEYLRAHPQVFMSETKELDYFAEELNWSRGPGWYEVAVRGAGAALADRRGLDQLREVPAVPRRPAADGGRSCRRRG